MFRGAVYICPSSVPTSCSNYPHRPISNTVFALAATMSSLAACFLAAYSQEDIYMAEVPGYPMSPKGDKFEVICVPFTNLQPDLRL